MTEDDGEWFTDPEHHWQASDLVKCVGSTAAVVYTEHDMLYNMLVMCMLIRNQLIVSSAP